MLTEEQWRVVDDLNQNNVPFSMRIEFEEGHPVARMLSVHNSDRHREIILECLRGWKRLFGKLRNKVVISKSKSDFSDEIIGKIDVDGMNIQLFRWDVCKVVGTRKVVKKVLRPVSQPEYVEPEYVEEVVTETVPVTDCEIREGLVSASEVEYSDAS